MASRPADPPSPIASSAAGAGAPAESAPGAGAPAESAAATGDVVDLAHLWADQFQHLTTLGVAGAGGVLVLLQAGLLDVTRKWWLSLALFALTAVFSLYGQVTVVDEASLGRAPGSKPRWLRGLALTFLGAAGGAAIELVVV